MNTADNKKHLTLGILAHVDAGKTTLSEALLYTAGALRKTGRVDHGDAFLDTDELEKRRGITIFSKQAIFQTENTEITLLDTPGHVDFSAETERTLQVLDAAVLVISAADGIQSHTLTLWNLLKSYQVPVFLFVNKMDQPGTQKALLLTQLRSRLDSGIMDFTGDLNTPEMQEELALSDERLMNRYLEKGCTVTQEEIAALIRKRKLFPCWFGSALRLSGISEFLAGLARYAPVPDYPTEFGARVFKISRDEQGNRLSWMKITGGSLSVKMLLPGIEEKADQLRLYSGNRFSLLKEASAGTVLAVTGLASTRAGEGLGFEHAARLPLLSPVLSYRAVLPDGTDAAEMLPRFRTLEEEEPALRVLWDEEDHSIRLQLMGAVQTEILQNLVKKRYGIAVSFDRSAISYRETIRGTVEGIGHFEPLRHYAEVHLLMEEGTPGSGLLFSSDTDTDLLPLNWQRLILTHLEERPYPGVLTGAPITDMKITLAAGRAHEKHTEGGDFRQATCRAIRQGLMQAESILLEPWYSFSLRIPTFAVGRALTDLERMHATFALGEQIASGAPSLSEGIPDDFSLISGRIPVSESLNYADEVRSYTKGNGQLSLSFAGYFPCHNAEAVIAASGYDPASDTANPADSVFCSHGTGTVISWRDVKEYMHLPSVLPQRVSNQASDSSDAPFRTGAHTAPRAENPTDEERLLSIEEIDEIINRTFFANRKDKTRARRRTYGQRRNNSDRIYRSAAPEAGNPGFRQKKAAPDKEAPAETEYLLVDGYNIIFAWEELQALAKINLDSARLALLDILSNYQGYRGCELIVVFDAYRLAGHPEEKLRWLNLCIVYTKTAQTADSYIEKFAQLHARQKRVTVATSDGMEQLIVRSAGSALMSAADLRDDILRLSQQGAEQHTDQSTAPKNRPLEEALRTLSTSPRHTSDLPASTASSASPDTPVSPDAPVSPAHPV